MMLRPGAALDAEWTPAAPETAREATKDAPERPTRETEPAKVEERGFEIEM